MENDKTTEYVNEVTATFTGVEIETNPQDALEVKRVKFVTDKGDITFKAKTEKEIFQSGILIKSIVPVRIDAIPEGIKNLAKEIQSKGSVKVLISYTLMNTEQDGEQKQYRFITSMKQFDKWQILPTTE